jgi:hypothetical protein
MIAGRLVIDLEGFTLDTELESESDAADEDASETETFAEGMGLPPVFISTKLLGATLTKGLAVAKVANTTRQRKFCMANLAL